MATVHHILLYYELFLYYITNTYNGDMLGIYENEASGASDVMIEIVRCFR